MVLRERMDAMEKQFTFVPYTTNPLSYEARCKRCDLTCIGQTGWLHNWALNHAEVCKLGEPRSLVEVAVAIRAARGNVQQTINLSVEIADLILGNKEFDIE